MAIPNLASFRKSLEGTPMYGEADAIYNVSMRNGINPAFVSGLAKAESSYGTAGFARGKKNPYGYGVFSGGPNNGYGSYADATEAMTKGLRGNLYYGAGKRSIQDVMNTYSPPSSNNTGQHIQNIINAGQATGGDASQVFLDGPTGYEGTAGDVGGATPTATGGGPDASMALGMLQDNQEEGEEQEEPSLFDRVLQQAGAAQAAAGAVGSSSDPSLGQAVAGASGMAYNGPTNEVTGAATGALGTPYSWGGGTTSGPTRGFGRGANTVGYDCSSLVQMAWSKVGVNLPRTTYDQINSGAAVDGIGNAKPGDLLFPSRGHVQMYLGNGKVVEAPQTGGHVQVVGLRDSYISIRRPG